LLNWLLGIARHKVEDHYRRVLREPLQFEEEDGEITGLGETEPTFAEILDHERLQKKTWEVLDSLPGKYRTVLLWRYWERRSAQNVAEQTGRTVKGVERLLARAREQFSGGGMMSKGIPPDQWFDALASETDVPRKHERRASSTLKSRAYSALVKRQQESGPLERLDQTKAEGAGLCVFEELVRLSRAGEKVQSVNYCRVCHARVLGEHVENAPIYWAHCPYVRFQNR
jgi:hypothetical protein